MDEVRILEIKQSVFASNDREADRLRNELKEKGVYVYLFHVLAGFRQDNDAPADD